MDLNLDIYNIFDLFKDSYKFIDFRSAMYNKGHGWNRIISLLRFSNESKSKIKQKYNDLDLKKYKTKNFEIQHNILEIPKWEEQLIELYEEIEDIDIDDVDEFFYDDGYDEFQSSFMDEFKIFFSNPGSRFYFTEEEIEKNSITHFNYNVSNKNEHHNQFNKFLNEDILILGEDNIYNIINRTLQLDGYNSQNGLYISILFPIYMKITDLIYNQDVLSGKVLYHEIFERTKLFFKIYSNPNYSDNSLQGSKEILILKDDPNPTEIDNKIFERKFSLDFKGYDCDPIFKIRALWEKMPKFFLIDIQRTLGIPKFQKIYEDLGDEVTKEDSYAVELPQNQKIMLNYENLFIKTDMKDYLLPEYNEFIELINLSAYDDKFYRILPVLLRTLFENLLYDIFQTGLKDKHKSLYFLKSQNRARDFSQLIALLNILKNKDFKRFHRDSINQDTISELKKMQNFGNWTVHQFLRLVDKDFAEDWEDKVNRILKALLVLYKKIKNEDIEIIDQSTLDIISKILNLKKSNNLANSQLNSHDIEKNELTQKKSRFINNENKFSSQKIELGSKFKKLYDRLVSKKNIGYIIIDIKTLLEDIGKIDIGKTLRMEYITENEERIMLIEPHKWNLSVRIGAHRHLRLIKYIAGISQTYDFEIQNQNGDILIEFLKLIKNRCKEQEINV